MARTESRRLSTAKLFGDIKAADELSFQMDSSKRTDTGLVRSRLDLDGAFNMKIKASWGNVQKFMETQYAARDVDGTEDPKVIKNVLAKIVISFVNMRPKQIDIEITDHGFLNCSITVRCKTTKNLSEIVCGSQAN